MIEKDLALALELLRILVSVAVVFQSMELISLRARFAKDGPWRWELMRRDVINESRLLGICFNLIYSDTAFSLLLGSQFICSLIFIILPSAALALFLFLSVYLIALRFRGTFNGGADSMTLIVLLGLCVSLFFEGNPLIQNASVYYVGIHCILSYVIAGWVKFRNPKWRAGTALKSYLENSLYDVPSFAKKLLQNEELAKKLSRALFTWEMSVVLLLAIPELLAFYLSTAIVFHFVNFAVFGLNRFLWAWLASYPALWFMLRALS